MRLLRSLIPILALLCAAPAFAQPIPVTSIQDEGTPIAPSRRVLDCVGSGISCTDDAANKRILLTVAAAAGGGTLDVGGAVQVGPTLATSVAIGKSGITTTVTGGLTQLTGAFSLTGNGASTITTTVGATTVDAAAAVNVGTSTATSVSIGKSSITSTVGGPLVTTTFLGHGVGALLTQSSNIITPTATIHHIATGLIKTITAPAAFASSTGGCLKFIPDASFTYDATGNIVVPSGGGTAVVNKLMEVCYDPGTSKWYPSY